MAAQRIAEINAAQSPYSKAPGQAGKGAENVSFGGAAFLAQLEHSSLPLTVLTQLRHRGLPQDWHAFRLSQSVSGQQGQDSTPEGSDS